MFCTEHSIVINSRGSNPGSVTHGCVTFIKSFKLCVPYRAGVKIKWATSCKLLKTMLFNTTRVWEKLSGQVNEIREGLGSLLSIRIEWTILQRMRQALKWRSNMAASLTVTRTHFISTNFVLEQRSRCSMFAFTTLTYLSHLRHSPSLSTSSEHRGIPGLGLRPALGLFLESHSLGEVNSLSEQTQIIWAHQMNKCTHSQVNSNMFVRVQEKQPFGTGRTMASAATAAAWDNRQGEKKVNMYFQSA